jgi:hypothetical protein
MRDQGHDIPEMGTLAHPDFTVHAPHVHGTTSEALT